ncbi:MAG: carbohydrate binding family 9 domain-containing protein, partial [Usitatibacter sp.]
MTRLLAMAAFLALAAGRSPKADAIEAHRLGPSEKIVLDGNLDDSGWAHAKPFDRFWEIFPLAEVEARVKTEVRFAYDDQALYAAVRAHDPDLSQLRAPFARRDNVLADQDMVVLFVDPVGSRKFAHFFRVNPRGSVADGLYNEDSASEDFSPDFDFEVATGRFPGGWTAELRIPFSSLRYGDPPSRSWSVMVLRNYPRDQRYRLSTSKLPREQNCFLCLNDPLDGLDELPSTRHLAVTPNLTARSVSERDADEPSRRRSDSLHGRAHEDFRYRV